MSDPKLTERHITDVYQRFLGRHPKAETAQKLVQEATPHDAFERSVLMSPEYRQMGRLSHPLGVPCLFNYGHLVFDTAKIVFCPIAKNANTSIKDWFMRLTGQGVDLAHCVHEVMDTGDNQTMSFMARSRLDLDKIDADPSWTRVAVLRDPTDRLISGYWDKFVRNRTHSSVVDNHSKPIYCFTYNTAQVTPQMLARGVTFRQFCQYLHATPRAQVDSHWTAQHRYLENGDWPHLFSIDNISAFERFVLDRCPPHMQDIRLGMQNRAPRDDADGASHVAGSLVDALPESLDGQPKPPNAAFVTDDIARFIKNYFALDLRLLAHATKG